jgi:hypothetical protein
MVVTALAVVEGFQTFRKAEEQKGEKGPCESAKYALQEFSIHIHLSSSPDRTLRLTGFRTRPG